MNKCCSHSSEHDSNESNKAACHGDSRKQRFDWILYGSLAVIFLIFIGDWATGSGYAWLGSLSSSITAFASEMWWGVALGIMVLTFMSFVPRLYFQALMGKEGTLGGLLRAAFAGLLLDMCSHGILMVGAKLYERGVSMPQIMTFLIASPWNSISLTLILVALIGLPWTLVFIAASAVIAVITGLVFIRLEKKGVIPSNPNIEDSKTLPDSLMAQAAQDIKTIRFSGDALWNAVRSAWKDGQMVIRWLLFGIVLASLIRTFVSPEIFQDWFGPSLLGLGATLVATTIIEVCSEGSTPIAADLLNRAAAPGNAFTFLMAGVATDYTELMVLKDMTKGWRVSIALPLVTVPQILVLGMIFNAYG